MPGFRSFANEINKQGPSANLNPTFDNFRKKLDASPKKNISFSPIKRATGGANLDQVFSSFNDDMGKKDGAQSGGAKIAMPGEEPYAEVMFNLQQKIKD